MTDKKTWSKPVIHFHPRPGAQPKPPPPEKPKDQQKGDE